MKAILVKADQDRQIDRYRVEQLALVRIFIDSESSALYHTILADVSEAGMKLIFPRERFKDLADFKSNFKQGMQLDFQVQIGFVKKRFDISAEIKWISEAEGCDSHPYCMGVEFETKNILPAGFLGFALAQDWLD